MGQQTVNGRVKDGGNNLGNKLEDQMQRITGDGGFGAPNYTGTFQFNAGSTSAIFGQSIDTWYSRENGGANTTLNGQLSIDSSRCTRTGDETRSTSIAVRFYIRYK